MSVQIKVDDVVFAYRSADVLNGITIDFSDGGLISIIGPNGVGKSTLLHCINRLIEPKSGCVFLDGRDVSGYRLKDLAKQMGYVPYAPKDAFPLTVLDTVVMGRHPYSRIGSVKEDMRAAHEMLEKLNIEEYAFRLFSELSAGQRQKVMLARGIVQKPGVLLLDEPTANLDVNHQMEVIEVLQGLAHDEGMTVIMVSHDLNLASKYSDRVVMMYEGRVFASGTPEQVITPGNMETVYGVSADVIEHNGRPYVLLNGPTRRS